MSCRSVLSLALLLACSTQDKTGMEGPIDGTGVDGGGVDGGGVDGGGVGGGGDDGEVPPPSSETYGFVFKGPMAPGSTLSFQAVDDALQPLGEPAVLTVAAWDGSYTGVLPLEGLVEVTVDGSAYNEAGGAWKEGEPLRLHAWALLQDDVSVQVNVLTDLTHERVRAKLLEGLDLVAAQQEAEAELHTSLGWSRRGEVETAGTALEPFGDTYDQSWLFALSSILARAGWDRGRAADDTTDTDLMGLDALLTEMRDGFAAGGVLPAESIAAMQAAELRVDPDLALFGLQSLLDANGITVVLPDIHAALDSDRDRVLNEDDNCRYIANEDQATLTDGFPYGAACDTRLASLSHTEEWGCGVLSSSGALTCWALQAGATGGTPPRPDLYPVGAGAPWGDRAFFTEVYSEVAVATSGATEADGTSHHLVCAARKAGGVECWDGDYPDDTVKVDDTLSHLRASGAGVCGLDATGSAVCYSRTRYARLVTPGPFLAVDVREDGAACMIRARDGQVLCPDATGKLSTEGMPVGQMVDLALNDSEGIVYGCAITAADGSLSCFGDVPLTPPSGLGYKSVAASAGQICAAGGGSPVECAQEATRCPTPAEEGVTATGLSVAGCVACGVDEVGLGICWPRVTAAAE